MGSEVEVVTMVILVVIAELISIFNGMRKHIECDEDHNHLMTHALMLLSFLILFATYIVYENPLGLGIFASYVLYHLHQENKDLFIKDKKDDN